MFGKAGKNTFSELFLQTMIDEMRQLQYNMNRKVYNAHMPKGMIEI